jgi:hypothetical protein
MTRPGMYTRTGMQKACSTSILSLLALVVIAIAAFRHSLCLRPANRAVASAIALQHKMVEQPVAINSRKVPSLFL